MQAVQSAIGDFRVNTGNLSFSLGAIRRTELFLAQLALRLSQLECVWFSPDLPDTLKRVDNMNLRRGIYEKKTIHEGIQTGSGTTG